METEEICPSCGGNVTDYIWLFAEKYYCQLDHVPGRNRQKRPQRRTETGALDWSDQ